MGQICLSHMFPCTQSCPGNRNSKCLLKCSNPDSLKDLRHCSLSKSRNILCNLFHVLQSGPMTSFPRPYVRSVKEKPCRVKTDPAVSEIPPTSFCFFLVGENRIY